MPRAAEAAARRLLRILFLWLVALSPAAGIERSGVLRSMSLVAAPNPGPNGAR